MNREEVALKLMFIYWGKCVIVVSSCRSDRCTLKPGKVSDIAVDAFAAALQSNNSFHLNDKYNIKC